MAAGLTDKLLSMEDMVALIDAGRRQPKNAAPTGKSRFKFQTETLP